MTTPMPIQTGLYSQCTRHMEALARRLPEVAAKTEWPEAFSCTTARRSEQTQAW